MVVAPSPSDSGQQVPLTSGQESRDSSMPRNDALAAPLTARKVYRYCAQLVRMRVLFQRRRSAKAGHFGRIDCCKCPWQRPRRSGEAWSAIRRAAVEHVQHMHPLSFAAHCASEGGAE